MAKELLDFSPLCIFNKFITNVQASGRGVDGQWEGLCHRVGSSPGVFSHQYQYLLKSYLNHIYIKFKSYSNHV